MAEFLEGNNVELLETGEEYFPALEAAIDSASKEIFLETYIFRNDVTGAGVAAALIRAAQRGVVVHVLVDGIGGNDFVRELMPQLEQHGVRVLIFRRDVKLFSLQRSRFRRMHRKLAVIDGKLAFVGGINIVDDYELEGPPHPRYDYAVRVEGPLLRPITTAAQRLWRLVSWANFRRRLDSPQRAEPQIKPAGNIRAAFLIRDNLRHRRDIENAYMRAIASAQREILIACAYFFPGRRFRRALVDAAERGVKITLLLQGVADHIVQAYATRALYPYFLENGMRLFEYQLSLLHAKVAVVDGCWATVGSSNIDPFSLLLAREANVVVEDPTFAVQLHTSIDKAMREGAAELRPETLRKLPLLQRLASWGAYLVWRIIIGMAGFSRWH